jgi:uncharacterized protein YcfJ
MNAVIEKTKQNLEHNIVGLALGAGLGFYLAHKSGHVHNKWALAGITIASAFIAAEIEAKIKAKRSMPTAKTITDK